MANIWTSLPCNRLPRTAVGLNRNSSQSPQTRRWYRWIRSLWTTITNADKNIRIIDYRKRVNLLSEVDGYPRHNQRHHSNYNSSSAFFQLRNRMLIFCSMSTFSSTWNHGSSTFSSCHPLAVILHKIIFTNQECFLLKSF